MTDVNLSEISDVTDESRAFSVDEVLASQRAAEGTVADEPSAALTGEVAPSQTASDIIAACFDDVPRAHAMCELEIERLVQARLDINDQIRERRHQLNMLERAHRIMAEPQAAQEATLLDD